MRNIYIKFLFVVFMMLLYAIENISGQPQSVLAKSWDTGVKNFQAPNVSTLNTFGAIPVSYFTGTPNIDIPLYELKTKDISIPISLKYHIGNVKPNIHPGMVGLGWNLLCGGSITRIQKGMFDEYSSLKDDNGKGNFNWGYLYPSYNYPLLFNSNDGLYRLAGEQITGNNVDIAPDQFVFNFGGYSGSFYLDNSKQWKVASETDFKIEYETIKYDETRNRVSNGIKNFDIIAQKTRTFLKFTLTAPDGTKYIFGGKEAIDYSVNYETITNDYVNSTPVATTWHLSKIVTPRGSEIEFTYQELSPIIDGNIAFSIQNNFEYPASGRVVSFQLIMPVYLKSIKYKNQELIKFHYQATTEKEYPKTYLVNWSYGFFPFDLTKDYPKAYVSSYSDIKWYQLSDIEINNQLKYKFYYTDSKQERLKLLKLEKLSITLNPQLTETYNFKYNSNKLPDYLSGHYDHLGFYNGADFSFIFNEDFYNSGNLYTSVSQYYKARNADITGTYLFSEILQSITYPTGGSSVFEYEPNFVYFSMASTNLIAPLYMTPSLRDFMHPGGMRIKKITNYTSSNEFANSKGYYYVSNYSPTKTASEPYSGVPSGILSFTPRYFWELDVIDNGGNFLVYNLKMLTSLSTNQAWYNAEGGYIGYSTVVETNEDEVGNVKGYTEYTFTNFGEDIWGNEHFDEPPLIYLPNRYFNQFCYDQVTPYTPFTSKAMERGKMTSEKVYDVNKQLKKSVYYKYVRTPSDTIKSISLVVTPKPTYLDDVRGRFGLGGINKIYTYSYLLSEKKQYTYDLSGNNPVITTENYTYDSKHNLLKEKTIIDSQNNFLTKKITYPFDYPTYNFPNFTNTVMIRSGMLNYPIEEKTIKNGKVINAIGHTYSFFNGNIAEKEKYILNISYPTEDTKFMQPYPGNSQGYIVSPDMRKEKTYDYYSNGSLKEVTNEKTTVKTVILWSYSGEYPIAEIKNATYSEVVNAISGGEATINSLAATITPNINTVNALRKSLPKALITTYTYKPLVGMLTKTDPNGVTTYYQYDSFGRLQSVKDHMGKIIDQYDYHYKK